LLESSNFASKDKPAACNQDICLMLNPNKSGISEFQRKAVNGLTKIAININNGILIKKEITVQKTYRRQYDNLKYCSEEGEFIYTS
jgi:hypothetical protein